MKIDLEAIKPLIDEIRQRHEDAKQDGDEMNVGSFGYEYGQVYSHNNLIKIADALEQLPKLVEVLQETDKAFKVLEGLYGLKSPVSTLVKQALEPFTNQSTP